MSDPQLNIIAFDVPYPPDYGGVIDVFYRIKALAETGVKIHLHIFQYGREKSEVLSKYCVSVTYYRRKRSPRYALSNIPFIVETRRDKALLQNLISNPFPILFEGIHTTAFLGHPYLRERLKLVRAHNIEHDYYQNLSMAESRAWKKYFFKQEARKLEKYEPVLEHADHILAISDADAAYFSEKYGKTTRVNPFHPFEKMAVRDAHDRYAFYHGNFSVPENREALRFLLESVFPLIDVPLVIAGKYADRALTKIRYSGVHVECHSNPGIAEMHELAERAAVHVLPTFQATGFKLKLLYSLFTAPCVVVNREMVAGTGMAAYCEVAQNAEEMGEAVKKYSAESPGRDKLNSRGQFLEREYSNYQNALKIRLLLR